MWPFPRKNEAPPAPEDASGAIGTISKPILPARSPAASPAETVAEMSDAELGLYRPSPELRRLAAIKLLIHRNREGQP